MSTQGQTKTDSNFVSEKVRREVEFVNPDYQPSVAELQEAHAFRSDGSTFDRKIKIEALEALYEQWVPVPADEAGNMQHTSRSSSTRTKKLVKSAIDVRCGEWVIWVQLDGESKRGATEG